MRFPPLVAVTAPLLLGLAACPNPPSADETSSDSVDAGTDDETESSDDSPQVICMPGETRCKTSEVLEVCAATGLEWEEQDCEPHEVCDEIPINDDETVAACVGPCEQLEDSPSSEGCSFYTTGLYQATLQDPEAKPPDGIVVGNPQDQPVEVELRYVPLGSNIEEVPTQIAGVDIENPVILQPGEDHVFLLDPEITKYSAGPDGGSDYRSGQVYHVVSNLPVVAYLHAPYLADNSNESTLLLPETVLQNDYIIYNHTGWVAPNYFIVIATQDQTTVTWHPPVETAGNSLPLPFVEAGESGTHVLNRFDNIRIETSFVYDRPKCEQDLSGTIIESDKPIWVLSAVRGLRLPWCGGSMVPNCPTIIDDSCNQGSDYSMEQNLPLDYWGRNYIAPHSPLRGTESHHWRIYAGEDDIDITVTPSQPGTPIHLDNLGDWVELIVPNGTNLQFDGTGAFMPVQYLTGHHDTGVDLGSPAMTQIVPTEQFLNRYVFVTGTNYTHNYVQIIREVGGASVFIDGDDSMTQVGWTAVGDGSWEVLSVPIAEGGYEITSDDSFGIMQYGYTPHALGDNSAGYAYMGGIKAEVIHIP